MLDFLSFAVTVITFNLKLYISAGYSCKLNPKKCNLHKL